MDTQLLVICILTFGINLIGTLAYAARIAGVRTRRIAMSFALFNVLVLVSRTANGFLGPFLAKRIESRLLTGGGHALADDFRMVLGSASLAVFIGILLVPTGQRLFARAIGHFQRHRSTGKLILRSATPSGLRTVREPAACVATIPPMVAKALLDGSTGKLMPTEFAARWRSSRMTAAPATRRVGA